MIKLGLRFLLVFTFLVPNAFADTSILEQETQLYMADAVGPNLLAGALIAEKGPYMDNVEKVISAMIAFQGSDALKAIKFKELGEALEQAEQKKIKDDEDGRAGEAFSGGIVLSFIGFMIYATVQPPAQSHYDYIGQSIMGAANVVGFLIAAPFVVGIASYIVYVAGKPIKLMFKKAPTVDIKVMVNRVNEECKKLVSP